MSAGGVLLLTRTEVASLLELEEAIEALEEAYRLLAERRSAGPQVLAVESGEGVVHAKAAGLELGRPLVAVKVNGNYPGNAAYGLPTIHGMLLIVDGRSGIPLAVMDSMEITRLRTGAATALAARRLARPESSVATVCGCGVQGRIQLEALARVLPLRRAYLWDRDAGRARDLARDLSHSLDLSVDAVAEPAAAARRSDVCVTCTPSRQPFLGSADVRPGSFVAAVGSDHPRKHELHPELVASAKLVVDDLESCAVSGELHHALRAGLIAREDVHSDLANIVAGRRPGRVAAEEVVVFDSTGSAVQDLATGARVYAAALRARRGRFLSFFDEPLPSTGAPLSCPRAYDSAASE